MCIYLYNLSIDIYLLEISVYQNTKTNFGCFNYNPVKNDMLKITNHGKILKKPLIYLIDTPGVEYKQLFYHLDTVDHVVKENLKLKQAVQI